MDFLGNVFSRIDGPETPIGNAQGNAFPHRLSPNSVRVTRLFGGSPIVVSSSDPKGFSKTLRARVREQAH